MTDPDTPEALLRAAFQALLRGDTAERDRLCALAEAAIDRAERVRELRPGDPVGWQ
jgi:hypothetical protein